MKSFLVGFGMGASGLAWFAPRIAYAEGTDCHNATGPVVVLRTAIENEPILPTEIDEVSRQLAVGLSKSGIGVCIGDAGSGQRVAQVEMDHVRANVSLQITLTDDVTTKTLERSVDLTTIPKDSRAVAIALYIEELLQASWAELALQKRVFLKRAAPPPPEIKREVEGVLPASSPARFRLALGGSVTAFHTGVIQFGPEFWLGFRVLPWLETSVRFSYRLSPETHASDGAIQIQSIGGGAFVDFVAPLSSVFSLHFPQASIFRV